MSTQAGVEVLAAALALGRRDRARLAKALIASLDPPDVEVVDDSVVDLHPDWEAEIERRERDVEEGRVQLIDGDEAFAQIRREIAERKKV